MEVNGASICKEKFMITKEIMFKERLKKTIREKGL
jgi:hypothetical protein